MKGAGDSNYDLTDEERTEVLALLRQEIRAASECQNEVLYPQDATKLSCDEDKGREIELISVIYESE
jgi:hypothetical protein